MDSSARHEGEPSVFRAAPVGRGSSPRVLGERSPGLFFFSPVSTLGDFSEFWPPGAYFVDSSFKEICTEYFPLKSVEKRSYAEVLVSAISLHFYSGV